MGTWNAELYDDKHQFVSKYGENLIHLLAPQEKETILDLGCGTGDLANQLTQLGASVVGVDFSKTMIEKAQAKYPTIPFEVQDATNLPFYEQFDAIFTNAALHWIKSPELAIEGMYRSLKKNGRLVGEMGGFGNISSIVEAIQKAMTILKLEYKPEQFPWYFPTADEYKQLLHTVGFRVDYIELYDRPTKLDGKNGMLNWLHMFSDSLFVHLTDDEKNAVYNTAEYSLREHWYKDGEWTADYCRLRFIAYK